MPRGNVSGISCIREHITSTYKHSKEETKRKYENVLYSINSLLRENGFRDDPRKYDEDTIQFLLETWGPLAISTKEWYLHILNRYLLYFNNKVIKDMEIELSYDSRPNVDWLTEEEYKTLLKADMTPLERTVIHLELCLGLRVSEVAKLRIQDVHFTGAGGSQYISVLGKGKGEGKWRMIPFHALSESVFNEWLEHRSTHVRTIREYDPTWHDPGTLLIWCHYKDKPTGGSYKERSHSPDRGVIHKVRERLGMNFKNHTLRRTCGRMLFRSGAPIESISKIFGHDDPQTTIKYLGLTVDDMGDALGKLYEYQLKLLNEEKEGVN